jgi:hypothetical protein
MPDPKVALPVRAVQRGSKWLVVDAKGSKVDGGGPFVSQDVAQRVANSVNTAWSAAKSERRGKGAPEITQEAFFGQDVHIPFDPKLHPRDRLGEFARVLARVHAGGHGSSSLIAGSSVRVTNHLGRMRVQHPGGSVHVKTPHGAAAVALFYHDEHHGSDEVKSNRLLRVGEMRVAERTAAREGDMAAWDVLGKAQRHVRLTTGPGAVGEKRARGKGVPGRLIAPVGGAASTEAGKPSTQAGLTGGHTTRELHDIFGTDKVSAQDLEDHIADLRDQLDELADSESTEGRRSYHEVRDQVARVEATLDLTRRAEGNRRMLDQGRARAAHNTRLHAGGA